MKKGSSNADSACIEIERQIQQKMKKMDWDYVPRANLAMTLSFYPNDPNIQYCHQGGNELNHRFYKDAP